VKPAFAFTTERLGDRAIALRFASRPTRELSAVLISLAEQARALPGVLDAVPGHRTVLIETHPGSADAVAAAVRSLVPQPRTSGWTTHRIPVWYDGPDLEWAADHLDMPVAEIVRMHAATTYDVRMIGSPGFVYLSAAPAQLHMPRRDEPRVEVAAGSVGIGGRQAGIYARAMPGGWRILGRAVELPELAPGDRVRFEPA
jgi:KipI family sensor histidine kinase inhibitor